MACFVHSPDKLIILFTVVLTRGEKNGYAMNGGDGCSRNYSSSRDRYRFTDMIVGCDSRARNGVRAAILLGVVTYAPANQPDRERPDVHRRRSSSEKA